MIQLKSRKKFYKMLWLWVIAIIIIGGVACSKNRVETKKDSSQITNQNNRVTKKGLTPMERFKKNTVSFSTGKYTVGTEIKPGLYYIENGTYWARLKNLEGDEKSIITNDNVKGTSYVEIKESDKAFELNGGNMYLVTDEKPSDRATSFGAGMFIVGKDIEPGTYKCSAGDVGYWSRLKDATGSKGSVIAEHTVEEQETIELKEGEFFKNYNCGLWEKIK